jgi:hypothetical protein
MKQNLLIGAAFSVRLRPRPKDRRSFRPERVGSVLFDSLRFFLSGLQKRSVRIIGVVNS